ncbi:MAG: hypothetical protein LRY36_01165 [Alphaproteobacteria bacterium]|nr:hypothetical protein [Alphaproteobacteria bacterium]MCD8566529.1 hypothetical protein [Alphaproteobacteria bacterium]
MQTPLNHPDGRDKNAFIFAHIQPDPRTETGWSLYNVSTYLKYGGQNEFTEKLKEYCFPRN